MPNSSSRSSTSSPGCFGCFGSLLIIIFVGSLIFGYSGILIRLGNSIFGFSTGVPPKTDSDTSHLNANNLVSLEKIVSEAVNLFHQQLSKGQFKEIYAQTDNQFKASISQADFLNFCQKAQKTSGRLKSTELLNIWKPVDEQGSEYILSRHQTVHSNLSVEEEFVWHFINGKLVIVKYLGVPISSATPLKNKQEI
jgi:hypothetical protein